MPSHDPSHEPSPENESEDRSGRIARVGPAHIWRQVADDIIAQIHSGDLPPGTQLPNEIDLARRYGVARDTLRNAKKYLVNEGYVQIAQGRGTFVRADHPRRRTS
ncbi:MAG TPA: GntR family transcriptional regulator [Amycolatopsis sp.]|nr:GntR family transcriptional regulator [Amycolatopsis sp.]